MTEKSLKIGIVMDPIAEIHYFEQKDLRLLSGKALGQSTLLHVRDDNDDWYSLGERQEIELGDLDAILMRKDPPFDMEYVYTTYILDRAEKDGALIVNAPQALRDMVASSPSLSMAWAGVPFSS
jgi:glutathione synthase